MRKPIAVLISDVHFNINTVEIASKALKMAIDHANELNKPLVIAGDLHDTKANLRAECIDAIISCFQYADRKPYVIVGNHDLINEKGEENSLKFLTPYCILVDTPRSFEEFTMLPYYSDTFRLREDLADCVKDSILIMHQGVHSADMGHYMKDTSSLPKETFKDFTVISGHYHRRQTIDTGAGRTFSYIGNPYTLTFGEADHPEKGFQVLYDDGSLEFIPTNLRRHVVIEAHTGMLNNWQFDASFRMAKCKDLRADDLLWVKLKGSKYDFSQINKAKLGESLQGHSNFKLDLIPIDNAPTAPKQVDTLTDAEIIDALIESTSETEDEKDKLKALWRGLLL